MQDGIKLTAKGHDIFVTNKSLTVDDKEYLYKGISAIKHSPAKQIYAFKYEGEWAMLRYDDDSEKKIVAIFNKIAELIKKRKALESKAAEPAPAEASAVEPAEPVAVEAPAETEAPVEAPAEPAPAEETVAEAPAEETPAVAEEETVAEAPVDTAEEVPAAEEKASEAEAAEEKSEDNKTAEAEELTKALMEVEEIESKDSDSKRKVRLKKSIIILIAVLVVSLIAGIAYFFILGPSSDSSQSPNTDTTHQYNDIEELIDEMEE